MKEREAMWGGMKGGCEGLYFVGVAKKGQ